MNRIAPRQGQRKESSFLDVNTPFHRNPLREYVDTVSAISLKYKNNKNRSIVSLFLSFSFSRRINRTS